MAQSFTDPIGGELYIPAAYPSITVAPNNSGLSTTGVVVLIGEADSGPAYSEETELDANQFGSDDIQSIVSKYKSGPLVDAAKAAAGAAVDPNITNTFSRIIPVKTNLGVKASSALVCNDSGLAYDSLLANAGGALGNLINYTITESVSEVVPTSGSKTFIPPTTDIDFDARTNGGVALSVTVPGDGTPTAAVAAMSGAWAGELTVTGGVARSLPAGQAMVMAVTANTVSVRGTVGLYEVTFTLGVNWTGLVVGDTYEITSTSNFAGTGGCNVGWYVVTGISGGVATLVKLGDKSIGGGTTGHTDGNVVLPEGIGSAIPTNVAAYSPVVITHSNSNDMDGAGKSFECAVVSDFSSVLDRDGRYCFYNLGTSTRSTNLVSVTGSPVLVTSATERRINLAVNRAVDAVTESFIVGGEIALKIGYTGYDANMTISDTSIVVTYQLTNVSPTVTVTLPFASYPTISDVVAYLNSLSGFTVSAGTAVLGNLPSSALDASTWGAVTSSYDFGSTWGVQAGRIKIDAYRLRAAIAGSYLVGFSGTPLGGLPATVSTSTFLAGGSKGATLAADITGAIDALEQVRCNFVVPCFSQDASDDYAEGLTESGSTYTIDAINAAVKTHVHKMSGMKTKRNRQAFLSKRDTFVNASEAAANIASHRCMMAFQDVKSALSGTIVQYQPYLAAALAAAMQAGAFYKSLVRKQVNVTGALQNAADWSYNLDSNIEDALKAGLNPIRKAEEGGFVWVSDQTTYGKDNKNFYNSVQMVYAGDIVALTTAQRMERAFVGQSIADVSAGVALSYLDSIMADFLRLKLIAPSSDALLGYKNAKVVISGATMRVSVEVKIAGSIYFIPIAFYVSEITQSA